MFFSAMVVPPMEPRWLLLCTLRVIAVRTGMWACGSCGGVWAWHCGGKIEFVITRSEQLSRAAIAAAFAVVTAAVSHTVAGGEAPSLIAFFASFWLALLASLPLVGKSASLLRISATVLIGQAVLHSLYAFFPAAGTLSPGASTDQMLGHNHVVANLPLAESAPLEQTAPGIAATAALALALAAPLAASAHVSASPSSTHQRGSL